MSASVSVYQPKQWERGTRGVVLVERLDSVAYLLCVWVGVGVCVCVCGAICISTETVGEGN